MALTQAEAADKLDMPQCKVSRWIQAGLVEVERTEKNRTPLTEKHIRELRTVKRLRGRGVTLQALRNAAHNLREHHGLNPFSTGEFAVVNGEIVRAEDGEAPEFVSRHPGQLLLFELAQEAGEVES